VTEEEEIEKLRNEINSTIATVTTLTTNIEAVIQSVIASHFSRSFEDHCLFCHLFFGQDVGIFYAKIIKIFKKFLESLYPDFLKQNPTLMIKLEEVGRYRNKFAHSMTPTDGDLKKLIGKKYFILQFIDRGLEREQQIAWNEIKEKRVSFKKIYDILGKLLDEIEKKHN